MRDDAMVNACERRIFLVLKFKQGILSMLLCKYVDEANIGALRGAKKDTVRAIHNILVVYSSHFDGGGRPRLRQ